jgi:hypothetical protein
LCNREIEVWRKGLQLCENRNAAEEFLKQEKMQEKKVCDKSMFNDLKPSCSVGSS